MSKLLEQLRALPAFNKFEKSINDNLTLANGYVEHFAPEQKGYYDEKDDDGKQICTPYELSDWEVEQSAIDGLLDDNGDWFEEFVHETLRSDVTELVRVLIKELRK